MRVERCCRLPIGVDEAKCLSSGGNRNNNNISTQTTYTYTSQQLHITDYPPINSVPDPLLTRAIRPFSPSKALPRQITFSCSACHSPSDS
jgi:hypothetical protein